MGQPARKRRSGDSVDREFNQEHLNNLLSVWIGGSCLPLSCVEDPNMKAVFQYLKVIIDFLHFLLGFYPQLKEAS